MVRSAGLLRAQRERGSSSARIPLWRNACLDLRQPRAGPGWIKENIYEAPPRLSKRLWQVSAPFSALKRDES